MNKGNIGCNENYDSNWTNHSSQQGVGLLDEARNVGVDVLPERRGVVRLGEPLDKLLSDQ